MGSASNWGDSHYHIQLHGPRLLVARTAVRICQRQTACNSREYFHNDLRTARHKDEADALTTAVHSQQFDSTRHDIERVMFESGSYVSLSSRVSVIQGTFKVQNEGSNQIFVGNNKYGLIAIRNSCLANVPPSSLKEDTEVELLLLAP